MSPLLSAAILFVCQFVVVLLLVVQSINNNHGRTALGMVTSLGIGLAQVFTLTHVPTAGWLEMGAFVAAGPFANLAASWVKRHDIAKVKALHA